ncbi:sensor histidine kinase [Rubellimicrobium rubrum]|uniref:sensor histidine kinase n=1 Tax=Rubellimicrobium rubrum TaxID=2585369 RepID=UPI001FE3739B|nr:sensor histidine kinase [Rubellimicrobium rubrum]
MFLLGGGLLFSAATINDLSDSAYDRSLAGAIRAIDLNVSTASGGIGIELPYPLFESFQATASGEVYFRVSTDDGLVEIGDALLPAPPMLEDGEFTFYDAVYLGRAVRVGASKRKLEEPLYGASQAQSIVIEVAETTGSREAFRERLISRAIWRDALTVLVAVGLLALGVRLALHPLTVLKQRLDLRDPDDRSRLDVVGLPSEVRPLVDAVNGLIERYHLQGEAQRRFIDDASHQLKTPLAVLRSQIDYALRADDPTTSRAVLEAMRPVTERAARMTSQLLSLARARNAALLDTSASAPVDLATLAGDVARLHLGQARRRGLKIEIEAPDEAVMGQGSEALLFEAASNLLDNAIRVSPDGGRILLKAEADAPSSVRLRVMDEGPGMSEEMLGQVGERFHAGWETQNGTQTSTGLGLSIVTVIMEAQNGVLILANRPEGGLVAEMRLPAADTTKPLNTPRRR